MEPLSNKQEQHVREELRQHEFPFDERAWMAMEVLLAESRRPGAVVPQRRYGWWLLLLATASALLLWQLRPTQKGKLAPQKLPAEPVAEVLQKAVPAQGKHALSAGDRRVLGSAESRNSERSCCEHLSLNKKTNAQAALAQSVRAGHGHRSHARAQDGLFLQPAIEAVFRPLQPSEAPQPSFGFVKEASAMAESCVQAVKILEELPPTAIRVTPTRLTTRGDLTLLSRTEQIPRPPRIEHGLIVGLGASVTQGRPLAVTPAPMLGYLFRYRFGVNTSLQTEPQVKPVSGYFLSAQIQDNTPTGPLRVSYEVEGLLFLELPIGVHHRYRPDQAFFVGVRPSWNRPMRTQTLAFSSSAAPTSQYDLRRGLIAFDLGVSVGWEWRLHPQWALDARLTQGTTNLVADDFSVEVNRLYNTDFQVSLRYFTTPDKRTLMARL